MPLPAFVSSRMPRDEFDRRVHALVEQGVCMKAAEQALLRLRLTIPEERRPGIALLEQRFRAFGGLLSRKDFCRRAMRYLTDKPDARPAQMAAELFNGPERDEIHSSLRAGEWYWRRIVEFRRRDGRATVARAGNE